MNGTNEIEHINKEIHLLQDLLKDNKKSLNQFQNGLMRIGRIRVKKGQRTNFSQTKKIQNIVKNIFQNKIKQIKKHSPYDRDDLDYYGIRDIENLFDEASEEDYYKPIFVLIKVIINIMKVMGI